MMRKNKLKLLTALLLVIAMLALTACGGADATAPTDDGGSDAAVPNIAQQPPMVKGGDTPFDEHGALSVVGTEIHDAEGEVYALRGMSTHGLAWFPQYVNEETFKYLRDEWHTNCVRLAMYTYEYGGYCSGGDKEQLKSLVRSGVDIATNLGMYVIVDWHVLGEQNPLTFKEDAKAFFNEMSASYGAQGNVLYEICNEPNGGTSWDNVKSYAEEVIPVIRANDPDGIIIVGTPTWSQNLWDAAAKPLAYDNVMYALHFYAATHKDDLRNTMETCINNGLPVFVSEFGICDASGNGSVDITSADKWKALIEKYHVSAMCWNLSNKNEASAIIRDGCTKLSGWTDGELSEEGRWVRDWFKQ